MVKVQIYNQNGTIMSQENWDSMSEDLQTKYFLFSVARSYLNKYDTSKTRCRDLVELRKIVKWFETTWGDINSYFDSKRNKDTFNMPTKIEDEIDMSMQSVLREKMFDIVDLLVGKY
jgi:hypothetical protein